MKQSQELKKEINRVDMLIAKKYLNDETPIP